MSVKSRMVAARSFYTSFSIQVPELTRSETKTQPLKENKIIPTKDDIRDVLTICDPMERAILLEVLPVGLQSMRYVN